MKVVSPSEAADLVPAGATIAICGTANVGVPEATLAALGDRYRETGTPGALTLYFPVEPGDRAGVGIDHLVQPGMLDCLIAGSFISTGSTESAASTRLVIEDKIAAYNLPMGVMYLLLRDIAAGRPGHITDVGLGTFVEPDLGGGKLTSLATQDLVQYVEIDGKRYLRYLPIPIDVAVIRGTAADARGNISLENEASLQGMLAMAQAAKASGGLVIAEVQRVVPAGSLSPSAVRVPGAIVDVVALDPGQEQVLGHPFRPELFARADSLEPERPTLPNLALPAQVVVRRAAQELNSGDRVSVGYGMAANLPLFCGDLLDAQDIRFFVEQGAIGGAPLPGALFGTSYLPDALVEMTSWFDYLDGGGFTAAYLGFGEADGSGSVNNHRIGNMLPGCGGFIDITTRAPKIVFCGTFTAGGLRVGWERGKLRIEREGRNPKFVGQIPAPTLSGGKCLEQGQKVMWITERAVLKLTESGLLVTEIAPGIEPEDLQNAALCELRFATDLKEMDATLFVDEKEGYKVRVNE